MSSRKSQFVKVDTLQNHNYKTHNSRLLWL
jgi:hypothetical protein